MRILPAAVALLGSTVFVLAAEPVGRYSAAGTYPDNREDLGISYPPYNSTGPALYRPNGGNWKGVWSCSSGRGLGLEAWNRQ